MGYKELYIGLVEENKRLQKANDFLRHENEIIKLEKRQWEQEMARQAQMMHQVVTDANSLNQRCQEEIMRLREELRAMRGK